MSALPPIADICQRIERDCFVPIADIQHEASIGRAKPVADACLGQNVLRACVAGCKDRWQGEGRWMNSLRRGLTLFTDN